MAPGKVAHQPPLFMGFPRQEYWSGLPFPIPGDLPDSGTEPEFPALQADSLRIEPAFLLKFVQFIIYPMERQWLCCLVLITKVKKLMTIVSLLESLTKRAKQRHLCP